MTTTTARTSRCSTRTAPVRLPAAVANGGFSVGTQGTDFFRGGDIVNGLTGVLDWSFAGATGTDAWRIRPTAANPASFTVANPRPATPPAVGGAIRAVGMNLLNYFTTIDTTARQQRPVRTDRHPRLPRRRQRRRAQSSTRACFDRHLLPERRRLRFR
jgi:predicted extracellular nuclease